MIGRRLGSRRSGSAGRDVAGRADGMKAHIDHEGDSAKVVPETGRGVGNRANYCWQVV